MNWNTKEYHTDRAKKKLRTTNTLKTLYLCPLAIILLLTQCTNLAEKNTYNFIFLGHTYDWQSPSGNKVDPRLEMIDYNKYDGVWLGGDICANTSLNPQTFKYLDALFDLKNPNSHFTLGNHDYRDNNLEPYFITTGRPDYYTSSFKSLVISVLNTNLNSSDCENLNAQDRMLNSVCDTIKSASHYILLMHHQIFRDIEGIEAYRSHGELHHYPMNCDRNDSYFHTTLYPRLAELEKRGIDVVLVVGDTGWHKGSEAKCNNGINFLASGINNSKHLNQDVSPSKFGDDMVLVFKYKAEQRELSWEFKKLNGMVVLDKEGYFGGKMN